VKNCGLLLLKEYDIAVISNRTLNVDTVKSFKEGESVKQGGKHSTTEDTEINYV
jgi:hypothetical protein